MSYYLYEECPLCGEQMCDGVCENRNCKFHWYPKYGYGENENEDD